MRDCSRTQNRADTPSSRRRAGIRARRWAGLAALLLAGCNASNTPTAGLGHSGGKLPVVTTILPVTLFTRAVAGDCAAVTPLIPSGSSPHAFQARPADLLTLRRARVLVINGLGMEGFLARLIRAADNPTLQVIDASQGVTPLSLPAAAHGDHGHAADPPADRDAPGGAAPTVNPHSWLEIGRAHV